MFKRLGQYYSSAIDESHVGLISRGRIHWFNRYVWPQEDKGIHHGRA
jgi:hypothetical protein